MEFSFKQATGHATCRICLKKLDKGQAIAIDSFWGRQFHIRCIAKEFFAMCIKQNIDIDELKKEVLYDRI